MDKGQAGESADDDIEITPEMIEAGERVLTTTIGSEEWFYSSAPDLAVEVYRAMIRSAPFLRP